MSGLVRAAVQQRLTIGVAGVPALLSAGLDGEAICAGRIAASACSLPCEPVVRARQARDARFDLRFRHGRVPKDESGLARWSQKEAWWSPQQRRRTMDQAPPTILD